MIATAAALSGLLKIAGAATSSHLAISPCNAGEHYQFSKVDCPIELRNTGSRPIRVSKAKARFPWDRIDSGTVVVPPKASAYLNATIDTRDAEGRIVRPFVFHTDEPGQETRGSEVRAFVLSVLDQAKPKLMFGNVDFGSGKTDPAQSLSLSSREVAGFRITGIAEKPDWLDVQLGPDGGSLTAKLTRAAPWGLIHNDHFVKLKINAPQQPQVWVGVEANVRGTVLPDANPFQLGVLRTTGEHEFLIRISRRDKEEFKIGTVRVDGISGSVNAEECVPAQAGCRLIRLQVSNENPLGKLEGIVSVELPEFEKTLPIEVVGLLLSPTTKIHEMDELVSEQANNGSQSSAGSAPNDSLAKALQQSTKKENSPPPGNGPLLRWSVAHQALIHGYLIYRADRETGPFLRVNDEVIPTVMDGSDKSGTYQWRDNSAKSGKVYWYRIGFVRQDGTKQDLTGAQRVMAK